MNKPKSAKTEITLDATGKTLGRLASEVVHILRGKGDPHFVFEHLPTIKVKIQNITSVQFKGKKISQKVFINHSQYPGGIKKRKISDEFEKNPKGTFLRILKNMLPRNRQRDKVIRNLVIE